MNKRCRKKREHMRNSMFVLIIRMNGYDLPIHISISPDIRALYSELDRIKIFLAEKKQYIVSENSAMDDFEIEVHPDFFLFGTYSIQKLSCTGRNLSALNDIRDMWKKPHLYGEDIEF